MAIRSINYPGIKIKYTDFKRNIVTYENKDGYLFEKNILYGRYKDPYFIHNSKRIYLSTFEPFVG